MWLKLAHITKERGKMKIKDITGKNLDKNYITKAQACDMLKVSIRTVSRYIKDGKLDTIMLKNKRYINKKSLEKYVISKAKEQ